MLCQLVVMCLGLLYCYVDEPFKKFSPGAIAALLIVSLIMVISLTCGIMCCKSCSRKVPCNYICLGLMTVFMTFLLMMVSAKKNP